MPQRKSVHQFCILCAKPDELSQVLQILDQHFARKPDLGGSLDDVYLIKGRSGTDLKLLATACSGMGDLSAAVAVADILARYNSNVIALVGTGASLDPGRVQLGDVVIPDKAFARGYDKVTEKGQADYEKRLKANFKETFFGDNLLCARVDIAEPPKGSGSSSIKYDKAIKLESGELGSIKLDDKEMKLRAPRIHTDAEILSCGMVVDSISYRDFMLDFANSVGRKGLAIDMESYGFWKSLSLLNTEKRPLATHGVIFRGISDYAGRKSQTETRPAGWKDIAVRNAAEVAISMFKNLATQL